MWVVAMAAKPGFDTFYPPRLSAAHYPIGIWIWSGLFHGFTVLERSLLRAMIAKLIESRVSPLPSRILRQTLTPVATVSTLARLLGVETHVAL
jgi:hypothetical protein